jgi:hypothetical protein
VYQVDPLLASKIVWLDAFLMNMDRTARNTNMLWWHKELWLIDHGASLYFHHSWDNWQEQAKKPFVLIKDHVLLKQATKLDEAHTIFKAQITPDILEEIVQLIPDDWLKGAYFNSPEEYRSAYLAFLTTRLNHADNFLEAAKNARA